MSLPVYLNTSIHDHMPNGSKNEWKNFYGDAGYELEANAFFPLFWLLLFSKENIKLARYIDDYDIDDEEAEIERQECLDDFGERTYPYFVVAKSDALKNLKNRKTGFLNIFGSDMEIHYRSFESLIKDKYGDAYILLRPQGLDLGEQSEQQFTGEIMIYEHLESAQMPSEQDMLYWNSKKQDLRRYKELDYFLQGADYQTRKNDHVANPNYAPPPKRKDLSETALWIMAIIVGIPAIIVFVKTRSTLYTLLTFILSAVIMGFVIAKVMNRKK